MFPSGDTQEQGAGYPFLPSFVPGLRPGFRGRRHRPKVFSIRSTNAASPHGRPVDVVRRIRSENASSKPSANLAGQAFTPPGKGRFLCQKSPRLSAYPSHEPTTYHVAPRLSTENTSEHMTRPRFRLCIIFAHRPDVRADAGFANSLPCAFFFEACGASRPAEPYPRKRRKKIFKIIYFLVAPGPI